MIYLVEDDESIRELVVYTLNSQRPVEVAHGGGVPHRLERKSVG